MENPSSAWDYVLVGDALKLHNGRAFKASDWTTAGRPIIRIQNLKSPDATFNYFDGELPDKFAARPGDLLFAWSGTPDTSFGAHVWNGPDAWINQHIFRVDFSDEQFDRDFLKLALDVNTQGYIEQAQGGVGLAHITKAKLNSSLLPAPPLAQQRLIAAAMRASEAKRQSTAAHLAAARRAVENFRLSILAAACSGRLTSSWRENHEIGETGSELVAAIGAARRARLGHRFRPVAESPVNFDLPDGWTLTTIGALVDVATGATPLRTRDEYYGGRVPWVTSGAVNAGYITGAKEYITELAIRETNAKVFDPGTLLVAMYGEGQTRGRVAELRIAAATNQAVAALLFDEVNECLRDYIRIFLLENYERIRQLSFGGVQPNLSLGVIRDTHVPLPPLAEQVEIVHRVNELLAIAAALHRRIDTAANRVQLSSRAILVKAFRGVTGAASGPI